MQSGKILNSRVPARQIWQCGAGTDIAVGGNSAAAVVSNHPG